MDNSMTYNASIIVQRLLFVVFDIICSYLSGLVELHTVLGKVW